VINPRAGSTSAAEADAVSNWNQLQANLSKALRESQLAVERSDEICVQVAGQN